MTIDENGNLVEYKNCDSCTLCCKILKIDSLQKPPYEWCKHCTPGTGCNNYQDRPDDCKNFACFWLYRRELDTEWKPARSKVVLYWHRDGFLIADFDPAHKHLIRQPTYERLFKNLCGMLEPECRCITIHCGKAMYVYASSKFFELGNTRYSHQVEFNFSPFLRDIVDVRLVPISPSSP
ncbi:hypothetical protein M2321_001480 [Rhodoblastus acidophilus]|nr:hypothetical protein [Rhodoblastus acidophilus]